jgi:SAM-dependent methyltransferase
MGTDYRSIYAGDAERYDALVRAEDADGHLGAALDALCPLAGARVLDVGTGTGRVACIALGRGASVVGVEPAAAMLAVARRNLAAFPAERWSLHPGTAQDLEAVGGGFDLVVAGWALGHTRAWSPATWREEIGAGVRAMTAAARPGGTVALVETLGTGSESPRPPSPELAEYYAWLEGDLGFERTSLRTDYVFESPEAAAAGLGFFFGDAFAARILAERWARVPECTGIWSRRVG